MLNDDTQYMGELADDGYEDRRQNADPARYWPDRPEVRRHRATGPRRPVRIMALGVALLTLAAVGAWIPRGAAAAAADYTTPVRAMFYYPWFPQTWHSNDHYRSALGQYTSDNPTIVAAHVAQMRHDGMQATIASWWGPGQQSEQTRFPQLYAAGGAQGLGVIPYYEPEGVGDPSIATIQSHLTYLRAYVDANASAVRIGGKPVIFVYNAGSSSCAEVTKWKQATAGFTTWYVNMKVFGGFASCADQPSSWHQYGPAVAESIHLPWSFNISPGFWHHNETSPRLARDPARWAANVAHMKASNAQWQLVTSFNEWGESTSVEASPSWQSLSGMGAYQDELHRQLVGGTPAPSPTATATSTPTVGPSPTVSTSPTATVPPTSPTSTTTTTPPAPPPTTTSTTSPPPPSPTGTTPAGSVTVVAAGDIVGQGSTGYGTSSNADGFTAELITMLNPGAVLTLGDNQYESGSMSQYTAGWGRNTCAGPGNCDAWGQHLSVMHPVPGNHEYGTSNAGGYRTYFGLPSTGPLYYSWNLGAWHFVALDSNVSMSATSAQVTWLKADLAANDGRPTLAYWHHPTWSSGEHGNTGGQGGVTAVLLADRDVQIVLAGHDHNYERFAPMGLSGPGVDGIRYWVVGTGGKSHYCANSTEPGSQVFNCNTYGVLQLTLSPTGYSWAFRNIHEVGASNNTFTDAGSSGLR